MKHSSNTKALLQAAGLKSTSARIQVIDVIAKSETATPLSTIQKALEDLDRITLYRTLEALKTKGIIHLALNKNQVPYYAMCDDHCSSEEHHHAHIHFYCLECKEVTCEEVKQELSIQLSQHQINTVNVNVEGICKGCLAA